MGWKQDAIRRLHKAREGKVTLNDKEVILMVARGLGTFTRGQLVVACWKADPKRFSMQGVQDSYPDSHRVLCHLWGVRGLLKQGSIVKAGPDAYHVGNPS